jgi:glutamate synthase domain-containing protein 1
MSRKSRKIVKHTVAELRAMEKRGEVKTDGKAAAKKPLPAGRDPDDAMEEIDQLTTEMPTRP